MIILQFLLAEMLKITSRKEVTRVCEGRNPLAVSEARIPADMVKMKMGAQHQINVIRGQAKPGQIGKEGSFYAVDFWDRAALVVAVARIDEHRESIELQDITVHAHHEGRLLGGRAERLIAV